jgi:tRNA wybutosine-synthesizing protein 1
MARSSSMVAASSVALTAVVVATTVFLLRRKRDVVTDEEDASTNKHATTTRTVSSSLTSSSETGNINDAATTTATSLEQTQKSAVVVVPPYGEEEKKEMDAGPPKQRLLSRGTVTIAYASTTGTCAGFAQTLHDRLQKQAQDQDSSQKMVVQMGQVQDFDWWDEILNVEEETKDATATEGGGAPGVILFVLPTFSHGTLPPVAQAALLDALTEITHDWRVAARPLKEKAIRVAAFGMGSSAYSEETFCKPARDVIHLLCARMGAERLYRGAIGTGDDEVGDASQSFDHWITHQIIPSLFPTPTPPKKNTTSSCQDNSCACASSTTDASHDHKNDSTHEGGCCQQNNTNEEKIEEEEEEEEEEDYSDDDEEEDNEEPIILDLEDMGPSMAAAANVSQSKEPKEMVTPKQAKALKKEGYKLIGTHSAVKLCRWTKHQLRGRGGCYKHTFYGITSYQCMEATPSLACANKCVFCWRHHKNPVAKEWKWKTDDPYYIVDEAVKMHVSMIKETKGIPGVQKERWEEAHTVRHCALSLVGEPIMYPRIDELLGDLHRRSISTFLVTNGQHPEQIAALRPITQLYVSVDAPTPESLDAIDRPLFSDAWLRLRRSLVSLKDKGQRTVARLTVVKGWNSDEIGGYAELIALGKVSLVEVSYIYQFFFVSYLVALFVKCVPIIHASHFLRLESVFISLKPIIFTVCVGKGSDVLWKVGCV